MTRAGRGLAIVGIGEDGLLGLAPRARAWVAGAGLFVGGARHLAFLGADPRPRLPWASPLAGTLRAIGAALAVEGAPVVVLASGDPSWHGVAGLLRRGLPDAALEVVPALSPVQLACARLGWAVEEVEVVSLHGRPMERLHRWLVRGRRLLLLTSGPADPAAIAARLAGAGWGDARLAVLERLGGPAERVVEGSAASPPAGPFDPLHLVALDLADGQAPGWATVPGLPDEAYRHDGQLTKREVRAVTLAALAPGEGESLWDVGAGSASIAIEWLRSGRRMTAIAIEREPSRAEAARANARALGVPDLEVIEGEGPACLRGLAAPDAVMVGGGVSRPGLLDACWEALGGRHGRLVANAVTLAGEAALLAFQARHGGRLTRLSVARAEPVGGTIAWRPLMPVTQLLVRRIAA